MTMTRYQLKKYSLLKDHRCDEPLFYRLESEMDAEHRYALLVYAFEEDALYKIYVCEVATGAFTAFDAEDLMGQNWEYVEAWNAPDRLVVSMNGRTAQVALDWKSKEARITGWE